MRRLLILPLLALLAGCGGHGGGSTPIAEGGGSAVLRIAWPASTGRLVPNAANSVVVTLSGPADAKATIARPNSTATLSGLAYGTYRIQVQAFPNADGTGVAQAVGEGAMTVTEETPGTVAVSMASTVSTLRVAPSSLFLPLGETTALTATALDAQGQMVLLSTAAGAERLEWTSDAPDVARVEGTGPTASLTGLANGSASVTARLRVDDGSGTVSASVSTSVARVETIELPLAASGSVSWSRVINGVIVPVTSPLLKSEGPFGTGSIRDWIAEFELSGIPAGSTIRSAVLSINLDAQTAPGGHRSELYAGDGQLTTGDWDAPTVWGGTLEGSPTGPRTRDVTDGVRTLLAANRRYAGLRGIIARGAAHNIADWSTPKLTLTYIAP